MVQRMQAGREGRAAQQEGAPSTSRTYTEEDFKLVRRQDVGLSRKQFEEFKRSLLGRPVPPQTVPDEELLALGYRTPDPWIQSCIEAPMGNWG